MSVTNHVNQQNVDHLGYGRVNSSF